jgi:RNA polymerase sigma-70 factor, ECF subfamily
MESEELALRMAGPAPEIENSGGAELSVQILKRAIAGDRVAFDQIILRYERRVFVTALRLLGRREDAQDAAQEVFLRLYRFMHRFDEKRALLPWLYRMTVNVCHDLHRRRYLGEGLRVEEEIAASIVFDPAREITLMERRQIIETALRTLTEKERAAIVLRDIEGLSTKDVAGILGSSETTVRSQISVARVKIKRFVDTFEKRHR